MSVTSSHLKTQTPAASVANRPVHIAIIMDGNGRWAQERRLPRIMGHRAGVEKVREIIKASVEFEIPHLTLYAFSQENWKRPPSEIKFLMDLLNGFLDQEGKNLVREGVRFKAIGHLEDLPSMIHEKIVSLMRQSEDNRRLMLTVALNYGSRREIIDAVKKLLSEQSPRAVEELDEEGFSRYLYTAGTPDPDLLIRTSGEMRLSNFLLWQCSYSELYISKKYWPDFSRSDLWNAICEFGERERRFGAVR